MGGSGRGGPGDWVSMEMLDWVSADIRTPCSDLVKFIPSPMLKKPPASGSQHPVAALRAGSCTLLFSSLFAKKGL